jgi:integrase
VFGWAVSEVLLPGQNPFNEIRVEASKGDGMSRDLFTLLELKKIFGTDLYMNYGASPTHKPYRYWLPLLLLTSGARRAEIAGLYLEDIRRDGRTWIIDINSKQPDKRLKTANAARVTPIHPEILKLGFVDYVKKLKKRNEVRLFPELRTLSDTDGYARPFGDWFSEYLKELGIYEKRKKTAHSFRHTHATMLQDAGVGIQRIEELQGRTFTEQTVGQTHYLHGTSIENLAKDVKLLNFSTILADVHRFG